MTIHRFRLQGEFIELNVLLKLLGLAPSGGAAKALIAGGAVTVDGGIETRIRRKLRADQVVRLAEEEIRIVTTNDERSSVSADAGPSQSGAARNMEPRKRRTAVTPSPGEGAGKKVVQ